MAGTQRKKPIRVLFNVWADADNTNAQSLHARDIALRLNSDQFETTMFYTSRPDPRMVGKAWIRLVPLPPRFRSVAIARHLIFGDYDVVFYPPSDRVMIWYKALYKLGRRKKLIAPVEGPISYIKEENPEAFRILKEVTLPLADAVIPISEYVAQVTAMETGLTPSEIIPAGVDTQFFSPGEGAVDVDVPSVLFVGRLIQRKGLDLVMKAAEMFPQAYFRIVGSAYSDAERRYVETLKAIATQSCMRNVEFVGKASQLEVRELMRRSTVLLHPSRIEGIPRVALEAAATGVPCVMFNDYQSPAVVDGVTGFLVSTDAELMDRLGLLLGDPELRRRFRTASTEYARRFDWDIVARQWEGVILRTLERP